jgi:thiosulfate dehydrogenase [quinone] large subunit
MNTSLFDRTIVLFFRFAMTWTFLYAAIHQISDPTWSVATFLSHTKTFHDVYAVFTAAPWAPIVTVLVEYGHLLIGLSLLFGVMVRVSGSVGIVLMLLYWTAHMDWPYIENTNNFILDYHLVYAVVLAYLVVKRAGHVCGLDAWAERLQLFERHPAFKGLFA